MTTDQKQILTLLPKIMEDMGAIPKTKRNKEQNYKFRSVDDVVNALHPVLVKHGVCLSLLTDAHRIETRQEAKAGGRGERSVCRATLQLTLTFVAPDSSSLSYTACGEGLDFGGDKATNKAMAAAYKYALLLGLCIPVEETALDDSDTDGQQDSHAAAEESPSTPAEQPKGKHSESLGAPCSDDQKDRIKKLALDLKGDKEAATTWLKAVLEKHGKAALADLTVDQAIKLIAKLEQLNTEKQAADHF